MAYPRPPARRGLVFWALVLLFLFAANVFDNRQGNPFAIPFSVEVALALFAVISVGSVSQGVLRNGRMPRLDMHVLGLVIAAVLLSALNAQMAYGQPLLYGVVEDRRILALLAYFPVVWAFRAGRLDEAAFYRLVLYVAAVAMMVSVLAVLAGGGGVSHDELGRQNRLSLGLHFIVLSAFVSYLFLWSAPRRARIIWAGWLIAALATVVLIVQTRSTMLLLAAAMALYSLRHRSFWLLVPLMAVLGLTLMQFFGDVVLESNFGQRFLALWTNLFSDEYLSSSARAFALRDIGTTFQTDGLWMGHGALSLMWKDGFLRVFGPHFFLADVGIAGMAFRYGIPATVFFIIWVLYVIRLAWRRLPRESRARGLFFMGTAYVLLSPGAGIFLYAGLPLGVLLGMANGLGETRSRRV